jgi:hypothetical protein
MKDTLKVIYVSTTEVPCRNVFKIVPYKIYKGIWDGTLYKIQSENGFFISILEDGCAYLDHRPWNIRTEEEYLYQELTQLQFKQSINKKADKPMTKELKNDRDVLQALLDGETIQHIEKDIIGCEWYMKDDNIVRTTPSFTLHPRPSTFIRIKPKTININGYEVPEPLREEPEEGMVVYCASWAEPGKSSYYSSNFRDFLDEGLLHLTSEAAILHRRALTSFTTLKKKV